MKPISTGREEWWCEWFICTKCDNCITDGYSVCGRITRNFKYCPDCGVEIDWEGVEECS